MATQIIPAMEKRVGFSSGMRTQLKIAPNTGTMNIQTLRPDTVTPGRFSSRYHKEKPMAEIKDSHRRER